MGRSDFSAMACSIIALIGAKPVPPAIIRMGFFESSRRKKVPCGPLKRRMSRSFMAPNTWPVNCPPGVCRICNCRQASSCGALASENARRLPSLSRISMYWPARNCRRSLAGSLSSRIITSGAARVSVCTRAGIVLTGKSLRERASLHSTTRSLCALAQQKSAKPAARSGTDNA